MTQFRLAKGLRGHMARSSHIRSVHAVRASVRCATWLAASAHSMRSHTIAAHAISAHSIRSQVSFTALTASAHGMGSFPLIGRGLCSCLLLIASTDRLRSSPPLIASAHRLRSSVHLRSSPPLIASTHRLCSSPLLSQPPLVRLRLSPPLIISAPIASAPIASAHRVRSSPIALARSPSLLLPGASLR